MILITIDTLRADRVGVNGGPAGITPSLDALGRDGAVFSDATAHAPLTLPSHASIMTGRYPPAHGVHDNAGFALDASMPTLAMLMHDGGYHTAAFVSSFVLRGSTGLARGFDVYDDRLAGAGRLHTTLSSLERRGPEVARDAARWLAAAERPYFLWVHFYDPHAPYDPPPAFAARFPGRAYDGEVAASDFGVATLLAALTPERRAETIVVATADHGEGLGDHGESEHGVLLYDSTLHVPLIMQGPGIRPSVVRSQVRHVDVLPTVLELTGVKAPSVLDGTTLVPLLEGSELRSEQRSEQRSEPRSELRSEPRSELRSEPPLSYAESRFGELHFGWSAIRSARDGAWKYIDAPTPELYDLRSDAVERADVHRHRPDTTAGLARALRDLIPKGEPRAASGPSSDADAAERLRSLGYVSGRVTLGPPGAIDPKTEIARYERYVARFNDALAALENGRPEAAEPKFRALAREFPRAFEAHQYLGRSLAARRKWEDAVAELDLAIGLSPREAVLYFDAARTLAGASQFDRALARVADGRRLEPSSFYGALAEGVVARAAGQSDRAEHAFREAVTLNPALAAAHFELGALAEARGQLDAARNEYRLALEGDETMKEARLAVERVSRGSK